MAVLLSATGLLVATGLVDLAAPGRAAARTTSPASVPRNPAHSLAANPDYFQSCALSGIDNTPGCLQVALQAIDNARKKEGLGPLRLPADFARLPFGQQMLLVVNGERIARHLAPVAGLATRLETLAGRGAAIDDLAPWPGAGFERVKRDAAAGFANTLDLDYQWLYDDGPGSGTTGCSAPGDQGCWADRNVVLAAYPSGSTLLMGAADDPTGDTQPEDRGGASMALVLAQATDHEALSFNWNLARTTLRRATLVPLPQAPAGFSPTGIPDPKHTEPPVPDYLTRCSETHPDDSPTCLSAVLAAINHARATEGVRPMVLPRDFAQMSTAEQLFVVINLERVDRNLPPFAGMTTAMDANAAEGADHADDPPDPHNVLGDDEEWSGGAVNALDADYGWMYNDGRGSGNLDCPRIGGPGCWDHRHGILDAFGTVGTMVLGAAYDPTGDTASGGWAGGTSMAVTLAVQLAPPRTWVVTWARVVARDVRP
ncbi:MAG: hypothetical protein FWC87_11750 [Acidimicrobiaceae bacterium]|nr:hypothetical protein [Acidimicrobiaceae bacterium]